MAGIAPTQESLQNWNAFFSRELLINVPHALEISFVVPTDLQVQYVGTFYFDDSKNPKEMANLRNLLVTGKVPSSTEMQSLKKYFIDTTNVRTDFCKVGKVEFIKPTMIPFQPQAIVQNPALQGKCIMSLSLRILMTVPFLKFDMMCIFQNKANNELICIPMKGLTSFVLEINDKELDIPQHPTQELERKITKSFKGKIKSSGQEVLICQLKGSQQLFEKQIKIHQSLRCSQIASFVYAVPSRMMLIFENPTAWTLKDYILENNTERSTIPRLLLIKFCLDISKAMNYLQVSQIAHRDLSTESVFVFSSDPHDYVNCKLGDVCCCERVSEKGFESAMTKPIYNNHAENFRMAPEISSKESAYTSQCDIYSFGILMFHILTGYLNTNPISESGNMSPMYTRQIPPAFVNIIDSCCAMYANERPKFSVVVERIKTIFTTEMKDENRSTKKKDLLKYPLV